MNYFDHCFLISISKKSLYLENVKNISKILMSELPRLTFNEFEDEGLLVGHDKRGRKKQGGWEKV